MKIVVVGAGLSGLAAAYRIRQAGHQVEVIEADDRPGGRCKAVERDGFLIDTGAEMAATNYHRWHSLVRDVGLGDDLVALPTVAGIVREGRLLEIDPGKPLGLFTSPLLSWRGKWNLVRGMFALRKDIKAVRPNLLESLALDRSDATARDVSVAAFGTEASERLIDAMLRPVGGTGLDALSALVVPYALSEKASMVSLLGGLDRLPLALSDKLKPHYGTRVELVHSYDGGVKLEVRYGSGARGAISADKCLITTQYDDAVRMYPRFARHMGIRDRGLPFLGMIDVKLAYSKPTATRAAVVLCPTAEMPDIGVIALAHNKAPDRAPAGHSLFSVFTEPREYTRLANMDDEAIVEGVRARVEALFPEVAGHLLFSRVARQPRTCMLPAPGFFHRAAGIWDAIGREPRVHLGGDFFGFGSMEAAVASGERAAARLLET